MDVTKPLVIDGVLWPANTAEPKDVLTLDRQFYYDSPIKGMTRLKVTKIDDKKCYSQDINGHNYSDDWHLLEMSRITLI